ncbi:MAG: hypothetical protein QM765_31565 [Myxococcales bacterium]
MRHKLLAALCRANEHQAVEEAQRPDPWLSWMVVGLLRQIERQRWMLGIIDERLKKREEDRGEVPGLPGWKYFFHGIGCCFSSAEESIDVDFHPNAERTIDPYFFAHRVHRLKRPGLPEQRLRALLPTEEVTVLALDELRGLGVVGPPDSHVSRLSPEFEAIEQVHVYAGWCERLVGFEGLQGHPRALEARTKRLDWLRSHLSGPKAHRALEALELVLDDEEFVRTAEKLVDGPPGPVAGTAIQLLSQRPSAPFCDAVPRLLAHRTRTHRQSLRRRLRDACAGVRRQARAGARPIGFEEPGAHCKNGDGGGTSTARQALDSPWARKARDQPDQRGVAGDGDRAQAGVGRAGEAVDTGRAGVSLGLAVVPLAGTAQGRRRPDALTLAARQFSFSGLSIFLNSSTSSIVKLKEEFSPLLS